MKYIKDHGFTGNNVCYGLAKGMHIVIQIQIQKLKTRNEIFEGKKS